jgi:hypothetical protein
MTMKGFMYEKNPRQSKGTMTYPICPVEASQEPSPFCISTESLSGDIKLPQINGSAYELIKGKREEVCGVSTRATLPQTGKHRGIDFSRRTGLLTQKADSPSLRTCVQYQLDQV